LKNADESEEKKRLKKRKSKDDIMTRMVEGYFRMLALTY
jgi:hypothetical protein